MIIGIDCGHTKYSNSPDYGAVGIKAESNLTREVGNKVISKLQALGHKVINCTCDNASSLGESLYYRVNKANNNNVDLFVCIHFNCYNGQAHGIEIFTYGGKHFTEVDKILNNIVKLGFTNRGIKNGNHLYVLNHTKAKSFLIECCFCDNKSDMCKYNSENFANAIVSGIVGKKVKSVQSKSFIKIDGGGKLLNNRPAINLIIRDYSSDIKKVFAWVDSDKNASWAFDITPENKNYTKLIKNCYKTINTRNGGNCFSPNANYRIIVIAYNKDGKIITKNKINLKTPTVVIKSNKNTTQLADDEYYKLQLGAYKNLKYAKEEAKQLKKKGIDVCIKKNNK